MPIQYRLASTLVALLAATISSAQDCKLRADVHRISAASGGVQGLSIDVGPAHAGIYYVVGSFSGTSPGQIVNGIHFPLNLDHYFLHSWFGDTLVAGNGIGATDVTGSAYHGLLVPPGSASALVGLTVHHVVAPVSALSLLHTCATNPVPLHFVP
jgi:hypothetical protein